MTDPIGPVAIVTGGGQNLGSVIAERFAKAGIAVAVIGRSIDALNATASRIRASGGHAVSISCDVADWTSVGEAVSKISREFGTPEILVNNAGGWMGEAVEVAAPDRFRQLVDATILGTFNFSKAVIPTMKAKGSGFILNIGSTSGLGNSKDSATASAPKAAIDIFSRRLAAEVQQFGIRVGVLHPSRVSKKNPEDSEGKNKDGKYTLLSQRQVAEIALFMIQQPKNVAIREIIVTPTDSDF